MNNINLNGKKYRELIDRIKVEGDPVEQMKLLATMVFMIATNDLQYIDDCLEKERTTRKIMFVQLQRRMNQVLFGVVMLILFFFSNNPEWFKQLWSLVMKIF